MIFCCPIQFCLRLGEVEVLSVSEAERTLTEHGTFSSHFVSFTRI